MVRTPCCKEEGIKKGAWTPEEDQKLIDYLRLHGEGGWRTLPEKAGLKRCGKSCRLRWANYLRPDIKRGEFSPEEDDLIIKLHALKGNKWAAIATSLAGRTDNEIKNYWNTNLKKRLKQKGLDPITHQPIDTSTGSLQPEKYKPVGTSGSARVLNRIASKYAVEFNRDLLTRIISGESKTAASTLLNKIMKASDYTASTSSDNCSFSDDDFNNFFSNEEISGDMLTKVDNFGFMEELKVILSYDYQGGFKDSTEVNAGNEMTLLDSWNEEEDDVVGVFV